MKLKIYVLSLISLTLFSACQNAGKNKTGSEYMPDMGHSVAYEANLNGYYERNRWGGKGDYYKYVQPRNPVSGTIARGVLGADSGVPSPNGASLYYYANTEEGRAKAMAEITSSPYPITDAGIAKGKELYKIFCATCHGEKIDGQGYLVREDGGKYPAQPANFTLEEHVNASNGRYIHAIVHGRNLMGAYADKMSEKERWQVIHYIRSIQAKAKNQEYSEKKNTFNSDPIYVSPAKPTDQDEHHGHQSDAHGQNHGETHSDVELKKGDVLKVDQKANPKAIEVKEEAKKQEKH